MNRVYVAVSIFCWVLAKGITDLRYLARFFAICSICSFFLQHCVLQNSPNVPLSKIFRSFADGKSSPFNSQVMIPYPKFGGVIYVQDSITYFKCKLDCIQKKSKHCIVKTDQIITET